MDLFDKLSKSDMRHMLEIAYDAIQCKEENDFRKLILATEEIISASHSFGVISPLMDAHEENPRISLIDVSCPEGALEYYFENNLHLYDKVALVFLETLELLNHKEVNVRYDDTIVYNKFAAFGMTDGFTHGVRDNDFQTISIMTFSGAYIENRIRTRIILKYLIPHLAEAMKQVTDQTLLRSYRNDISLTGREREVLHWLKEGKSSWDISHLLSISERTVNFHIENIRMRLNAGNRTHAVAIALKKGLIDF